MGQEIRIVNCVEWTKTNEMISCTCWNEFVLCMKMLRIGWCQKKKIARDVLQICLLTRKQFERHLVKRMLIQKFSFEKISNKTPPKFEHPWKYKDFGFIYQKTTMKEIQVAWKRFWLVTNFLGNKIRFVEALFLNRETLFPIPTISWIVAWVSRLRSRDEK